MSPPRGRATTVLAHAASAVPVGVMISGAAAALTSLPGWLTTVGLLVVTALGLVHRVFPQASADRLAWWQSWWARRH